MLQILREKTTGWVAIVIMAALAVPIAFFGIENYFQGGGGGYVAKVNGVEIRQDQFQQRFDEYRNRMRQALGESYDASQLETPLMRRQMLDAMIDEEVLRQASENNGLMVPPEVLQKEIGAIAEFQVDGRFDPELYRSLLSGARMTPRLFEERIARDLLIRALPRGIGNSSGVSQAYLDQILALREQRRSFDYLILPAPAREQVSEPSEADIEAYYQSHLDRFQTPESVQVEYVELLASRLEVSDQPDDETLRQRYEESKARYVQPEMRLVSHILIQTPSHADAAAQQAAQAKAAELANLARQEGADFAALAREHSEDPGSKALGGELGWIERGVTDPGFEEALFSMEPGVSDPVKGSDGWHVLWLREVRPASGKSFEQARDEVRDEYLSSERDRLYSDQSGRLIETLYRDPSTLALASDELGLQVQSFGPVTRAGAGGAAGLFSRPDVLRALFSESVLEQGQVSDVIELEPGHAIALRVSEHKPAAPQPLAEVRAQVQEAIYAERLIEQGKAELAQILAQVDSREALERFAASRELELKHADQVGRNNALVDPAVSQAAFALSRPEAGQARIGSAELLGGAHALIALTEVIAGDPSSLEPEARERVRQELVQAQGMQQSSELLKALRRQARIDVVESRM